VTRETDADFELYVAPGHLLRRAQQLHTSVFAEMVADGDLTTPQFAVLSALHKTPQIDQVTLSLRLAIDRSTIADVVARLEDRSLIKRTRDKRDGRRNVLELTPTGEALYRSSLADVVAVGKRLLDPLTEREQATLLRLLTRMIAANDHTFAEANGHYGAT
jgi:DNA-binding MarR family transcriptional regulator